MIKGFKEFIMRGNVVDLAIAVVIGAAFGKVVDTFVSGIVTPLISAAGKPGAAGLGFDLKSGDTPPGGVDPTFINLSTIINAIIVFLLTALVVYAIFVAPMNKFNARREAKKAAQRKAAGIPEPVSPPSELDLLTEIRDLLVKQDKI
ncbi:large conductance mechanosensitive channel protein MscL [Nakamurella sp. A5-74]|uniref:Large-conductance mechanosensitive channel n=1 Tax=Nakamurella sp. A5-74 TaxID=3158264 RepID=A0AAU8DMM2_9ACTN